jgi:sphinganine-1-phosphate aldolase
VLDLFNGKKEDGACGMTTSGGTESIILAVLAYREYAKKHNGVTNPNLVISHTAHAAFDKACFYLNVEIRKVQ